MVASATLDSRPSERLANSDCKRVRQLIYANLIVLSVNPSQLYSMCLEETHYPDTVLAFDLEQVVLEFVLCLSASAGIALEYFLQNMAEFVVSPV